MDRTFTTDEGRVLELNIVSQALLQKIRLAVRKEFETRGEPIEKPFYFSVEPYPDGSGGEKVYWDDASIERDGDEQEKEQWRKHKEAVDRLDTEDKKRTTETLLLRGLKPEDRTPDPQWAKEQQLLGIELPETPRELSLEYIQIEILKTPGDIGGAIGKLTLMSMGGMFSQEDQEAVEASFRLGLVEIGKRATVNLERNQAKAKGEAEQVRVLVLQSEIATSENGAGLGAETISMG